MMQISYTDDAFASLIHLVNFIESTNTQGAGVRWLSRFESFLETNLHTPELISTCNNITFSRLNLRCIYFNDWVIAFSLSNGVILIEALLHKSRIGD